MAGMLVVLIQDKEKYRALQNAVINLLMPWMLGKMTTSWKISYFLNLLEGILRPVCNE